MDQVTHPCDTATMSKPNPKRRLSVGGIVAPLITARGALLPARHPEPLAVSLMGHRSRLWVLSTIQNTPARASGWNRPADPEA